MAFAMLRTSIVIPEHLGQSVMYSALCTRQPSADASRLAKDLVWRWMSSRWPSLVPSAAVRERNHVTSSLPGRALEVATSGDGRAWTLSVATQDRENAPVWITRASVRDTGTADELSLETACSNVDAAAIVAPPALLGTWVERLELDDLAVRVLSEPQVIDDEKQASTFLEKVVLAKRRLPLLVLAAKGSSKYYGVDPRVLAVALRGLAHVACLAGPAIRRVTAQTGRSMAPVPGAVRIYLPADSMHAAALSAYPTLYPSHESSDSSGKTDSPAEFRRQLIRRVCDLSVCATAATRRVRAELINARQPTANYAS